MSGKQRKKTNGRLQTGKNTKLTTLPRAWPFPRATPAPLTKKQLRDITLRESEKAPF